MALFNRLSGPQKAHEEEVEEAGGRVGDTRLRRANTRFQTQPITQGEVDQVSCSRQTFRPNPISAPYPFPLPLPLVLKG